MGVWDRLISGQAGPRTHVGRVGAAGLVGAAKSSPLGQGLRAYVLLRPVRGQAPATTLEGIVTDVNDHNIADERFTWKIAGEKEQLAGPPIRTVADNDRDYCFPTISLGGGTYGPGHHCPATRRPRLQHRASSYLTQSGMTDIDRTLFQSYLETSESGSLTWKLLEKVGQWDFLLATKEQSKDFY